MFKNDIIVVFKKFFFGPSVLIMGQLYSAAFVNSKLPRYLFIGYMRGEHDGKIGALDCDISFVKSLVQEYIQ